MAYKQGSVKGKPWQARVTIDGQRHLLGYFATKQAAFDAEAAFRLANRRPAEPRAAQNLGLALGLGHRTPKYEHRTPKPILDLHPCFECPLAECDDTSRHCALRAVFNFGQNAKRHKRPLSDFDQRRFNIARSELAAIHKENLADA